MQAYVVGKYYFQIQDCAIEYCVVIRQETEKTQNIAINFIFVVFVITGFL